jgi:hypothetical protein
LVIKILTSNYRLQLTSSPLEYKLFVVHISGKADSPLLPSALRGHDLTTDNSSDGRMKNGKIPANI